ncbi:iron reductase [Rhodofomes roseus]|uniref:ferric-chelate reductase (NADPH) n=1 Tax=Rhodofomes roseus TaxID=34475 RepID=A0ABQ8KKH3_9APHY|nr:iron reductase [Rhodofomes roseus]KAH9838087.1 iron reductase [Rhodofomes roseus]
MSAPSHSGASSSSSSPSTSSSASNSSNSSSSSSSDHSSGGADNSDVVVVYVDIFLLCVLGLLVFSALPRAITRLSRASEWARGLCLYRVDVSGDESRRRRGQPPVDRSGEVKPYDNVEANVQAVDSRGITGPYVGGQSSGSTLHLIASGQRDSRPPKHMPTWATRFPGLSWLLSIQVLFGYSIGTLFVLLTWLDVILYAGLVDSNPFSSPGRAGILVVSQLPLVYVLGTKNNVVGTLIGQGYERLNYLHRFVGRFLIFAINVHAIGIMYEFTSTGAWSTVIVLAHIRWGLVGLVCMDFLFLFSVSSFRQRFYHVFYASHIVSAIILLIATCFHNPTAQPYIFSAVAIYALDRVLRVLKSRVTTAHLHPILELSMVRVQVHGVNGGWRAGQHVRIKVLSIGMGIYGWMEPHPFTIASVAENANGEGLTLMCKKAGDWTGKLYTLAQGNKDSESQMGKDVTVLVEGPYGGPGNTVLASYSGAMLVTGGSGLTYGLSVIEEFLQMGLQGTSSVLVADLIWSVPSPSNLFPMIPHFTRLLEQAEQANISLRISVSYTRAVTANALQGLEVLPPGLTLAPGRPRLEKTLESVVERTCEAYSDGKGWPTGVFVGACGPLALTEEAGNAVRNLNRDKFHAVGGIEVQEENFSW